MRIKRIYCLKTYELKAHLIDHSRIPHMPKQTIACKRESPCKAYVSVLLHGEPRLHAIVCLGMYGIRERSINPIYAGRFRAP